MSKTSNMTGKNSSENLSLFLDGELSPSQEVPLFTNLASDDGLRSEMRNLVAIKNSIHSDSAAFVPPVGLTAAVFNSAGYALPGAFLMGLKTLLVKYFWVPVLAAVIAGLGTFAYLNYNYNTKLLALQSNQSVLSQTIKTNNTTISELLAENERLRLAASRVPETREIIKYIKVPTIISKESEIDNKTAFSISDNSVTKSSDFTGNVILNNSELDETYKTDNLIYNPSYNANRQNYNDIALEGPYSPMRLNMNNERNEYLITFRGMNGLVYPQVNTSTTAGMTNFAFGMFFRAPYEGVVIGAEFGRESFSQSFYNTEYEKKYLYEQLPNIWWGGAGLIGVFDEKIDALFGAQPYGKIFLGGSEIGPLGKIGGGLQWSSSTWGLGAFLGIEGSMLGYQNQGTWYTSQKIGLTYGMSIQF